MHFLVDGKIPAHTPCRYKKQCIKAVACTHQGKSHPEAFSCGAARAYETIEIYNKDKTVRSRPASSFSAHP